MEDNLEGLRKMLENGKDMAYVDSVSGMMCCHGVTAYLQGICDNDIAT